MKNKIFFILTILSTTFFFAQDVKFKKQIVYVDNVAAFSFDKKAMGNEIYIYKLTTHTEFVHMTVDNFGTESKVDDGKNIIFSNQKTTIVSKKFRGKDWDFILSLLLLEKVIDLKGEINNDNLIRFKAKYDDGNVNHTMMR